MNTYQSLDDDALRQQLKTLDPQPGEPDQEVIDNAWDRIAAGGLLDASPRPKRRWLDLALAACLGAALVGGGLVVSDQFTSGSSDSAAVAGEAPSAQMMDGPTADSAVPSEGSESAQKASPTIARDASAVVATDDVRAARDSFIATVSGLGGTVTSESTTTRPADGVGMATDIYPPMPSTPGITLAVEVPTDTYDEAVAAVTVLGQVVQFTQSSQEVGAQYAEGKARIASLRSSLTTLRALMGDATSVSDVIALEDAIAQRQSDLDALTSQQRYLESQVSQARITVQLVTPDDAAAMYGTSQSWWQQVGQTLASAWAWLGRVLLWTSPLWILGLLWWGWRRRRV